MSEFGVKATQLSAPQGAGSEPVMPVKTDLGFIGDIGSALVNMISNSQKAEQEARDKAVLDRYTKELEKYRQASVQTGNSGMFLAQQRAKFGELSASFPHLTDKLSDITKAWKGGTELGGAEEEEKSARAAVTKQVEQAISRGYQIPRNASEALRNAAVSASQQEIFNETRLKEYREAKTFEMNQGRYQQEVSARETKELTAQLLADSAGKAITFISTLGDELRAQVQNNPASFESAQLELQKQVASLRGKLKAAAGISPELASQYETILTDLSTHMFTLLDPSKASTSVATDAKNKLEMILNASKLKVLNDPEVLAATVNNQLFSNNVAAQIRGNSAAERSFAMITGGKEFSVPPVAGQPEAPLVVRAVGEVLKDLQTKPNPQNEKAAITAVNRLLKQYGDLMVSPEKLSPEKFKDISNLVASPEFGLIAAKLDSNSKRLVNETIKTAWVNPAIRSLDAYLNKALPRVTLNNPNAPGKEMLIKDAVEVVFEGSGAYLRAIPMAPVSELGRYTIQREAEDFNRSLNKLIKMGAHLEGTQDYKKFWEDNRHIFMPEMFSAPEPKPSSQGKGEKGMKAAVGDVNSLYDGVKSEDLVAIDREIANTTNPAILKILKDAREKINAR